MNCFLTPDSYEKVSLSFEPMYQLMLERGITALQLAEKVGVKVDIIRNMYKYEDTVTLSLIRNICEALGCDVGDLMSIQKVMVIPPKRESSNR